ncbi:hypothetical protein NKDENANG_01258 [Candidatus Entotheonellaceae bacterium PAL068K]
MRFAITQGFNSGDPFFAYLRDTFGVHYSQGKTAPKRMSVDRLSNEAKTANDGGLHCRLVGRPGRAAALARFLERHPEP